jgi:large subunit ribosomal protein L9
MATQLKVLLQKNVENLGQGGEVVRVRPGFARNFLLPRGLAVPATGGNLARVEDLKRVAAAEAAETLKVAKDLETKLGAVSVQIERASGDEDRMWGSVTGKDIEEAFHKVGITIDRRRLVLPEPIKRFGAVEVPLKLHHDVIASLKVEVTKIAAPAKKS